MSHFIMIYSVCKSSYFRLWLKLKCLVTPPCFSGGVNLCDFLLASLGPKGDLPYREKLTPKELIPIEKGDKRL